MQPVVMRAESQATLKPLGEFSYAMPFPAVRADLGAVRSLARYFPNLSGSSLFKEQGLLKAVSWLQGDTNITASGLLQRW